MILVIPSILLYDWKCSLCIKGETGTDQLYKRFSDNPAELCCLLRRENAKSIHITDKDSFEGRKNYKFITSLSSCVDIPIQLLSDFTTIDECKYVLDNGIYRIIINDLTVFKPEEIKGLKGIYNPSRIIAFVNSDGLVVKSVHSNISYSLSEYLDNIKDLGFQRILLKVNDWLKNDEGIDIEKIINFKQGTDLKVTLLDGVTNYKHLRALNDISVYGIDSIVLEEALFNNNFPCQKIWRMVEAELEK
jgi:phosphoribosylformimino-5-aminoimidazole carboxamide ribotide isomerase